MFAYARKFNGDISRWAVSRVTTFQAMFDTAEAFNRDLNLWDVSGATNMVNMFRSAKSFSQTLCGAWATSKADKTSMFMHSPGQISSDKSKCPGERFTLCASALFPACIHACMHVEMCECMHDKASLPPRSLTPPTNLRVYTHDQSSQRRRHPQVRAVAAQTHQVQHACAPLESPHPVSLPTSFMHSTYVTTYSVQAVVQGRDH